jgi:hypothetical protein
MTTLKYKTNLNCGSCVAAVRPHLDSEPTIRRWSVDTDNPDKILTVEGDDLSPARVRQHVSAAGFQVLAELNGSASDETGAAGSAPAVRSMSAGTGTESEQKSFFATYRPLLLVLAYLLGIVALVEITAGTFDWMRAMRNFMGGFFVAFSFFKLLDLRGFVTRSRPMTCWPAPSAPTGTPIRLWNWDSAWRTSPVWLPSPRIS